MPAKYRLIQNEIKSLTEQRNKFEAELQTALYDLEKLQNGNSVEDLINQQNKVQAFQSLISNRNLQFESLQSELNIEREREKRKSVNRRIREIDEKAEKAGARFVEIYSDTESLSYKLIWELVKLKYEIFDYKQEFHNQTRILFPNIQRLINEDLPELRNTVKAFLDELKSNGCALRILRAEQFSSFNYATDDYHAFSLPPNDMSDWIRLSMGMIEQNEINKARKKTPLPTQNTDKPSKTIQKKITEKIAGIIPLRRLWE